MDLKFRHLLLASGLHALVFALLGVSAFFQRTMEPPAAMEAVLVERPPQPAPPPPEPVKEEPPPEPPKPEPKPEPAPAEDLQKFKADIALRLDCSNLEQMRRDAATRPKEQRVIMLSLLHDRDAACRKAQEDKKKKEEAVALKKQEELSRKAEQLERKRQMEQEAQRLVEEKRKREQADERRRQQELASMLGQEEGARLEAERRAKVNEWAALIEAKVRRNWLRPPGSPSDFTCVVRVQLLPGGSVVSAKVAKSCGGAALDDSVEKAVLKSDPLPMPSDPSVFDRNLNFNFEPKAK